MATQRTSGVGAARERETERESAGTYMPEHGASRAQEHVQILCGDTCTFYQILLDNARDAGSCIVTPALSLSVFPSLSSADNQVALCSSVWHAWCCAVTESCHCMFGSSCFEGKTHPHFAAGREISVTVDAGVQGAVFTCSQLSDSSADPSLWNVRRREPEDESVAILRPLR